MKNRVEAGLVLIENQIRPVALGRKNFLFAGSHTDAQRAALIYSLLGTCKINNINPNPWLTDVLRRIPNHPINAIDELLSENWTPEKEYHFVQYGLVGGLRQFHPLPAFHSHLQGKNRIFG